MKRRSPAAREAIEASPPEENFVIIVEVVAADNVITAIDKPMRNVRTDKARRTCDQDFHLIM